MLSVSWPWCSKFAPKPESTVEPSGNIGAVRVTDLARAAGRGDRASGVAAP
jgi:hypothetical protein